MAKSTNPITYHYTVDGADIACTRKHIGTAYPKNGNVSNPTEYFLWDVSVDGVSVMVGCANRADAYEYGRAHVLGHVYVAYNENYPHRHKNLRSFTVVADEMKANYSHRTTTPKAA